MFSDTPIAALSVADLRQIVRDEIVAILSTNVQLHVPYPSAALYTVKDLSRIFRRSEAWVQRLILSGALDGVKIGGDWRVSKESIDAYLQGCTKDSTEGSEI